VTPVGFLVLLVAGALVAWVLGGVVLRLGGCAFVIGGVIGLVSGPGVEALGLLVLGCLMWLVGHWHYALRHGVYKSGLVDSVIGRFSRVLTSRAVHLPGPIRHAGVSQKSITVRASIGTTTIASHGAGEIQRVASRIVPGVAGETGKLVFLFLV
jgi:hypothetical protein